MQSKEYVLTQEIVLVPKNAKMTRIDQQPVVALCPHQLGWRHGKSSLPAYSNCVGGGFKQIFFIFIPTWGNDPI